MLLTIRLILAGVFVIMGVLLCFGKGAWLISGYNKLPAEEKEKYDKKKMCRSMAKLMFAFAFCLLLAAVSELLHSKALFWIGIALFFAALIGSAIYMNTGNRYKK